MKEWLTSPVVAGRLDEIGRSLERRRVMKEEEEDPLPDHDQRVPDAERGAERVGAGVNTLLGDAPSTIQAEDESMCWWTPLGRLWGR